MSPVFLQPGRDASTLTFKTYEKSAGDYTFEGVYVSTTGNSPTDFTQVWTQNNPSASWKTVTVDLSAYQGNIVYIAFVYTGINGHTWLIDNVEITESWLPCNSVTAPYNQTFDSNLSSCWYVIDSDHSGDERCWKYDETNHCAVHPWGQQNVPQEGWLFSSRVELPSSNTYKLSFRSKNASSGTGQRNSVWIAVDKTGTPKISDYTQIWVDPSYSSSWTTYEIDLSQYAGHYVNIAFKYEGTFAHKWYIDDFNIVRICAITASANPSAGGSVSGTGTYNYGSTVTLTATPSTGYHFVNWTKNGTQVSTSSTYSFIASTNVSYVANFALNSYNITVTPNPSTGGSVSGAGTYNYGSTVTLTATPSTGYHFVNWTKNGTQVSTNLTYSFTANANAAYVANFALNSYNITATTYPSTGGFVTGGGTYNYGSTCTLTATSHAGYVFLAWTDNSGVVVSSDPVYSFEVTESKTLTANFMAGSDACSLTFDLYDSYGDGWNGNYLVVNHANGMSEKLAVPSNESFATFTLPFVDGSHVELSWITGSWTYECSFDVHYPNGNLVCVGRNLNGSFEYGFDMDCDGMPSIWAYVGDHSDNTSNYLPSYSYFNYSLSEQIYTANEIGTAGVIRGIAFYNAGTQAKTRTFDIYMKTTEKTAFASQTDWISASVTDKVFSGSVTIRPGKWTPIVFNTPFTYNGTSNIVLIVDDNTGDYTSSPHMACRVFNVNDNKALRIYSDNTDYDPNDPSVYNGILMSMKNQIQFDFLPSIVTQTTVLSQGWNWWSTYIEQGSINGLTMLENSLGGHGLTIKAQDAFVEYNNPTNTWTGGLNAIDNESGYKIKVSETCASVMAGPIAIPVNHPITLVQGWNWIGYPVTAAQVVTSALSGFTPSTGDIIKSQDAYASYSAGTGWTPSNYTLTPGECYMYYSGTSVDKTLVFAQSKGEASYKPEDCHWKADHHVYPDNLSVMAIVTVDGEEQRGDAIEIGAFVDGECRGSVKLYYVESLDRYIAFLTVTGKDGEEVEFRLLDESNGKTDTSPDHIFFRSNAIIGSFDSPYPIRFGAMASSENGLMRLYPNPVTRSQSIKR